MKTSTAEPGLLSWSTGAETPSARPAWIGGILHFLNRRRILISAVVFVLLIGEDVVTGVRPHDIFDFRDYKSMAGLVLIIAGVLLRSWAAGILRKDFALTISGPYQLVRNPLYVGSFLMMIGVCLVIDDRENLFFVLGPMLLIYLLKVRSEETKLKGLFGDAFTRYAASTPRFFPRHVRTNGLADWRLAQWLRSREYRAVASTLLALAALKIWYILA